VIYSDRRRLHRQCPDDFTRIERRSGPERLQLVIPAHLDTFNNYSRGARAEPDHYQGIRVAVLYQITTTGTR